MAYSPESCSASLIKICLGVAAAIAISVFVQSSEQRIIEKPYGAAMLEAFNVRGEAVNGFRQKVQLNGFLVRQGVEGRTSVAIVEIVTAFLRPNRNGRQTRDGSHPTLLPPNFYVHEMAAG